MKTSTFMYSAISNFNEEDNLFGIKEAEKKIQEEFPDLWEGMQNIPPMPHLPWNMAIPVKLTWKEKEEEKVR